MPTRRSVLATSSGALLATLAGCNVLSAGDSDAGDSSDAQRWLTAEVARIPYEDPPALDSGEHPPVRRLRTGRPGRARTVDGLSELGMEYATGQDTLEDTSLPLETFDEVTSLFSGRIAIGLGEFDAPTPPADATEAGSHRDASLYVMEAPSSPWIHNGIAIDDGVYVRVRNRRSPDAADAALRSVLDAEAGEGTRIDGEDVDRVWSFLEDGFYTFYAEVSGRGHAGNTLRAEGDTVHRRAVAVLTSEPDAEQHLESVEAGIEDSDADDERSLNDFSPYDDVSVDRDGRAVTIEGSLPATAVSHPEFTAP